MSLDRIFDIAGSGMAAQSIRLNTTASNIANANSAASSEDEVYRAKKPIFSAVQLDVMQQMEMAINGQDDASRGVQVDGVVESEAPLDMRYEPHHPKANDDGYVMYPNVNIVEEMANMISASRSYQTNVQLAESAKNMLNKTLQLGQR